MLLQVSRKTTQRLSKNQATNQSGITLIALVVTIVVLLILAGITISLVFSDNGIIKKAQEAVEKTNQAIINEQERMNELADYMESMINSIGEESAPEVPKRWEYDEERNVTNGKVTLKIGDYVDYNCKTGQSITSYAVQNGCIDQTFTTDSYNYGWRVLGVNEKTGELLILSEELIGPTTGGGTYGNRTTYYLQGQSGYVNGVSELDKISAIYGKGKGATGARCIKVEDINKITGYNPNNVGVYDPEQTGLGKKCYTGQINEYGNKVTYTKSSSSQVQYSATNGKNGIESYDQFIYYTGSEWKSLNVGESIQLTSTTYYYYPDTLTTSPTGNVVGIEKNSEAYKMLFTNSSTGANIEEVGKTTFKYYLGSTHMSTDEGRAYYNLFYVGDGRIIENSTLFGSFSWIVGAECPIRPVVSLSPSISLINSNTQKDGCTLWNIED